MPLIGTGHQGWPPAAMLESISSPSCKDEFTAALARQNDMGIPVLFPIYIMSAPILYFRNLHYADCREGNAAKLSDACFELSGCLLQ
jgi:hypothetical protein